MRQSFHRWCWTMGFFALVVGECFLTWIVSKVSCLRKKHAGRTSYSGLLLSCSVEWQDVLTVARILWIRTGVPWKLLENTWFYWKSHDWDRRMASDCRVSCTPLLCFCYFSRKNLPKGKRNCNEKQGCHWKPLMLLNYYPSSLAPVLCFSPVKIPGFCNWHPFLLLKKVPTLSSFHQEWNIFFKVIRIKINIQKKISVAFLYTNENILKKKSGKELYLQLTSINQTWKPQN